MWRGGKGMDGMGRGGLGKKVAGMAAVGVGHSQNNALKRLDNGFRMG